MENNHCIQCNAQTEFVIADGVGNTYACDKCGYTWERCPDILDLENQRFIWSKRVFKKATAYSSLQKAKEEIEEVEKELSKGHLSDELITEYADIVMCVFDSIQRSGLSIPMVFRAFEKKLLINQLRDWKENPDGTYSHVKQEQ